MDNVVASWRTYRIEMDWYRCTGRSGLQTGTLPCLYLFLVGILIVRARLHLQLVLSLAPCSQAASPRSPGAGEAIPLQFP